MSLTMYIYDITDNNTQMVIYVGQTYSPKSRFQVHKSLRKRSDLTFNILESINTGDCTVLSLANELEKYWIEQMIQWGFKLENKYYNKKTKSWLKKRI